MNTEKSTNLDLSLEKSPKGHIQEIEVKKYTFTGDKI
tara:strand:- start:5770 stop:5880 length:111 start_codon:yes stop_codon:yes gene_type:complete